VIRVNAMPGSPSKLSNVVVSFYPEAETLLSTLCNHVRVLRI
jgi:hypothetical protein